MLETRDSYIINSRFRIHLYIDIICFLVSFPIFLISILRSIYSLIKITTPINLIYIVSNNIINISLDTKTNIFITRRRSKKLLLLSRTIFQFQISINPNFIIHQFYTVVFIITYVLQNVNKIIIIINAEIYL